MQTKPLRRGHIGVTSSTDVDVFEIWILAEEEFVFFIVLDTTLLR